MTHLTRVQYQLIRQVQFFSAEICQMDLFLFAKFCRIQQVSAEEERSCLTAAASTDIMLILAFSTDVRGC